MVRGIFGERRNQKNNYMPIEVNGQKSEVYVGCTKGIKSRVKFKILSAPLRAQTEDKGVIEKPLSSYSFQATYTMRNASGGHDVVKYFERKTPHTGKQGELSYNYTPEFLMIENGELIVNTKTHPDLYYFLNNHPDCATNPAYDVEENREARYNIEGRRTPFTFSEVEKTTKKKKEAELDFDTQVAKCVTLITDEKEISNKAAATLYRAYGFGDADELIDLEEFATMRKALVEQAKVSPTLFMTKMESSATTLEARVNDCINKGIIVYEQNGDFNGFIWGATSAEKKGKGKNICAIEGHQYEERVQLFIDFLRTDSKGIKIADEMKREVSVFGLGQN